MDKAEEYRNIVEFIRSRYPKKEVIHLHEPTFGGKEKEYMCDCIDTTFVSSIGAYVDLIEKSVAEYTGTHAAVAMVNGTSALHVALKLAGVKSDELVITQALSFVATCNAISYLGAAPLFVDIDLDTLGMSPDKLELFLNENVVTKEDGFSYHRISGRKISACLPMHTYGHPCRIDDIVSICEKYGIPVVEDAAESLGSTYKGKHTGSFGLLGVYSFNGNKTITSGGGGLIVTNDKDIATSAKHISTTSKIPHAWEFDHDEVAFNYRMPNINAALACAQFEQLPGFIAKKRILASDYESFFYSVDSADIFTEPKDCSSNYWLNTVLFKDKDEVKSFLKYSHEHGVMSRPSWKLMSDLEMYKGCHKSDLSNAEWVYNHLVCLPSSVTE